ncbi:MAG: glutamate-1-semialdehyde 2,1-aminomutase [candidate division Zixibacteria bacterium]|nr:glutamate-1-semialdehyde 2,1-aminomutase [candidate division Zixibacteria bacterium]
MLDKQNSGKLFQSAKKVIPGGVNSPVRAFGSVGGTPVFVKSGDGAEIADEDGNKYIDYVMSWGPLILGHCHPQVIEVLEDTIKKGTSFGAPTALEEELARFIVKRIKSIDKLRLVNSGTEATMTAIRLARAYTDRPLIIKLEGCYHGHSDGFLTQAGSGMMTSGMPASPGIPEDITALTIGAPYNSSEAILSIFRKHGEDVAAVIAEPIAANMGVIPPVDGYLQTLRDVTADFDTVLIFDEVISGFRVAFGGAQELYEIEPDLTCFGKIIGGGLPVGAIGGRAEIMDLLAPEGSVYQAGTLSGNPLAVSAGLATLKFLDEKNPYIQLDETTELLEMAMTDNLKEAGIEGIIQRVGSIMTLFFTKNEVRNFDDAKKTDTKLYRKYFHGMLDKGIYLAPSAFEAMFISTAHTTAHIERTIEAQREVFKGI